MDGLNTKRWCLIGVGLASFALILAVVLRLPALAEGCTAAALVFGLAYFLSD